LPSHTPATTQGALRDATVRRTLPASAAPLIFAANYAALVAFTLGAGHLDAGQPLVARAFALALCLTYPALYLVPVVLVVGAVRGLRHLGLRRAASPLGDAVAAVGCAAVVIGLWVDLRLHHYYGYHLNGFVWNLVTTPGGIRALGASDRTYQVAVAGVVGVLAAEAALVAFATRLARTGPPRIAALARGRTWVPFLSLLAVLAVAERFTFAVSDLRDYDPVLRHADSLPFYMPLTFKHAARRLGFDVTARAHFAVPATQSDLAYPASPLRGALPDPAPNVLWLCAESLRADAIDVQGTPALAALASRSLWFQDHLSGGNGTRMGVFSMFYGLPGSYWFSFLRENRGPVLLDWVIDHGYQVEAYTSDDFSYPEFAQTVFARVPREHLHEARPGFPSWQRDRETIASILAWLGQRDRSRPFFVFAFLESPHAHYDFPPESVVATPFLEDFDYLTSDPAGSADLLHNRYRNSVRHLDQQIARLLDALADEGIEGRTIVVVTGDHGEEFMEKGRWGHGSQFSEEQIRVPLLLRVPGVAPDRIERLTSHLDLPATLLARLGVESPPSDYGSGMDLLGPDRRRFAVVADWNTVGLVDDAVKLRIPLQPTAWLRQTLTARDDSPLEHAKAAIAQRAGDLADLVGELGRFRRRPAAGTGGG